MKDLGPTLKGRRQEMGAVLMQGNTAAADSFLTTKIREAGFNIMGRTTTPEFGVCGSVENERVYISRNPGTRRTPPAGPRPGPGRSWPAGLIPISHASDGGGSIAFRGHQRECRAEAVARGVSPQRPMPRTERRGQHTGLPQPDRTRHAAFFDTCRGPAPGELCRSGRRKAAMSNSWRRTRRAAHRAVA